MILSLGNHHRLVMLCWNDFISVVYARLHLWMVTHSLRLQPSVICMPQLQLTTLVFGCSCTQIYDSGMRARVGLERTKLSHDLVHHLGLKPVCCLLVCKIIFSYHPCDDSPLFSGVLLIPLSHSRGINASPLYTKILSVYMLSLVEVLSFWTSWLTVVVGCVLRPIQQCEKTLNSYMGH